MTVDYIKEGRSKPYGQPTAKRNVENGAEYELYLHIVGLFNDAVREHRNDPVNMFGFEDISEQMIVFSEVISALPQKRRLKEASTWLSFVRNTSSTWITSELMAMSI
ncbi:MULTISPECIES: hypothetical protein [unclassified Adlercreutzia]|uniref:hypothetical protein n=1 Tax=unclassified Adlercreutzia TaxID=2636013 RepID=UPI0013E9D3A8|nr:MULTISPECIES: hypothetical protein [unclassified Adlercreutzia]